VADRSPRIFPPRRFKTPSASQRSSGGKTRPMLSRYLLLGVLISFSHLMYGSTLVTASISCQIIDRTTGNVVFNDSHGLTITDPSTNFNRTVSLDCGSPYGSVVTAFSQVTARNLLALQGGNLEAGMAQSMILTPSGPQYEVSAVEDIRISQQRTFMPAGATGIGFLKGIYSGSFDDSNSGFAPPNQFVTTPFGSCNLNLGVCSPGPVPFSYQFTFGQPFTLDVEGELTIVGRTFGQFDSAVGADVGVDAFVHALVDANGNPIPGATVDIPETGTGLLTLAGVLLVLLHSCLHRRGGCVADRNPRIFPPRCFKDTLSVPNVVQEGKEDLCSADISYWAS
jgi:hypothetical protein